MKTIGDYKTEFMDNHFVRARIHYAHAKEKHPYFADIMLDRIDTPERTVELLNIARRSLELFKDGNCANPFNVLFCEVAEAKYAISNGDNNAAVEELYDCIAVLLRTIDVIEGRQRLGKPEGEK